MVGWHCQTELMPKERKSWRIASLWTPEDFRQFRCFRGYQYAAGDCETEALPFPVVLGIRTKQSAILESHGDQVVAL